MFGQNDKNDDSASQPIGTKPVNNGLLGIDDDDNSATTGAASPVSQPSATPPLPDAPSISVVDEPQNDSDQSSKPASTSITPDPVTFTPSPYSNTPAYTQQTTPPPASTDDLANIKRQALQDLSPLINHLDQNPEEKFKTTMMMIQASDDKDLIPQAYQVAKGISDEKKRAQALLDIVNEINYFTHKTED